MLKNIIFAYCNRFYSIYDLNSSLRKSMHYEIYYFLKENNGTFQLNGNFENIVNNRLFFISPNVEYSINCIDIPIDCFHISFDFEKEETSSAVQTPYFIIVPQEIREEFVKLNIQLAAACLIVNKERAIQKLFQILEHLEQMNLRCCIAFATRNFGRIIKDIPRHFHYNEYQVDFFESGSGAIYIKDRWYNYSSTSLCFIPPDTEHEITFSSSSSIDNYSIKFQFLDDSKIKIPKEPFVVKVAENKRPILLAILKTIVGNFVMDLKISTNNITSLIAILQEIEDDETKDESKEIDLIKKVKVIVSNSYTKELSISRIAYDIGLSPEYLSRQFKKSTRQTLVSYINNRRLEESLAMMQKTTMSLKQIASECGFKNINYFSTCFKKHYSIAPRDFRKKKDT